MDLSDIPFDVPVILHSIRKRKNLQNPVGTKQARRLADNRDVYEQLVLRHVDDDKVAIQSARNERYLQVRTNGHCVFDSKRVSDQALFDVETDSACSLFFVSCFTGHVLQCDDELVVKCENKTRMESEAWRIVEPRTTSRSSTAHASQSSPGLRYALSGRDRQHLILDLAKGGKTPDEIEQIVTRLFDSPAVPASNSAYAIPIDKK
ncbi:hypothetical protein PHYPSEUDO_008581 [Phytophthora pseudosyringae]|uniref:Uncharacterized protein n=1 Tax=Phytophthora pseudosyringae TaxID=221518 RepID=A0A8T1VDP0_9STRA|nr:hypothetical protein PHYPSEUDO_008581 [Phytophthora pseudosyringae]